MIRKRVPKLLTILATAACIFGFVLVAPTASENLPSVSPLPIAGAEVLPNGYDVNCTKVNDLQVLCTVAGCPRVNVEDDLAGDELHVHINGDAANGKEVPKACGDVYSETINIDAYKPFTYHVQGVRHHDVGSDDLSAYSVYQYNPPPKPVTTKKCEPAADFEAAEVAADAQCVAKPKPPVKCEPVEDFETPEVPFGQQCKKLADVTNAIQGSFGDTSGAPLDFNVTNSSRLEARCDYKATTNSLNPLVPRTTTRQFNVPANGNHTESFDGVPTLSNFNVTLTCFDASGKQKAPIGSVNTTVRW